MKIICLIRPDEAANYFVNAIHDAHGVAHVVREVPSTDDTRQRLLRKLTTTGIGGLWEALQYRLQARKERAAHIADYQASFGDLWQALNPELPYTDVSSINDDAVQTFLQKQQPDLVLVYGTSIIKSHILASVPLALNLHWGLSPYYKGIRCTDMALINWDPYNIGVTIHKIASFIDGGDILIQSRIPIQAQDTAHAINTRLTQKGTALIIEAITRMKAGEPMDYHSQDKKAGLLITGKQWGKHLNHQVAHIERTGAIARMLTHPAKKVELPIKEKWVRE